MQTKYITYAVAIVAAITLALVMASKATGNTPIVTSTTTTTSTTTSTTVTTDTDEAKVARRIHGLRTSIVKHTAKTWHYQDLAGVSRTKSAHAERHTKSVAYLHWINHRWYTRQKVAHKLLVTHYLPYTNDWQTAVRIVQRDWPGTASFMLSCSAHEGGHGGFVMNTQGSGAGGWMQYMESTFNSHFNSAMAYAKDKHMALPPINARSWTSPLAQAFAAGWGYHFQHSAWTGDPACW